MLGYNSANIPSRLGSVERKLPDLLRAVDRLEVELDQIKNPPQPPRNIAKELGLKCNCGSLIENLKVVFKTDKIIVFGSKCLECGTINKFSDTYLRKRYDKNKEEE